MLNVSNPPLCQVVVMESGKVLEMGSPVELAALPGGQFEKMLSSTHRHKQII